MTQIAALKDQLKRLKLSAIREVLEIRLQEAAGNQLSHAEFLTILLDDEIQMRLQRKLIRLIKAAAIGNEATLESFDFHFNPAINAAQIKAFATGEFMRHAENIFLVGPTGTGKTHLTKAICHAACRRYMSVAYVKFYQLFSDLKTAELNNRHHRLLKRLCTVDLLAIDDFAFRKINQQEAEYLYAIADARYRNRSLILNANRDIADWIGIFPDPIIANAIMDRLAHNAHQITITGASYRKKIAPQKKTVETKS